MSTVTTTKTTKFCNFCKSEIIDDLLQKKSIDITTGHVGQGTDWHRCYVDFKWNPVIPYGGSDIDICKSCLIPLVEEFLDKLQGIDND